MKWGLWAIVVLRLIKGNKMKSSKGLIDLLKRKGIKPTGDRGKDLILAKGVMPKSIKGK